MKKLFLILLLSLPLLSSAGDTSQVKLTYEDVKSDLVNLAKILEGPAKHTYQVYVKQYHDLGVLQLIGLTIGILLCLILIFSNVKNITDGDGKPGPTKNIIGFVIGCIFILAIGVSLINYFAEGYFTYITNPEYHAINKIINSITK